MTYITRNPMAEIIQLTGEEISSIKNLVQERDDAYNRYVKARNTIEQFYESKLKKNQNYELTKDGSYMIVTQAPY